MTFPTTATPGSLRQTGVVVSAGSFESPVEVDGPAAPPVSTGSKIPSLHATRPTFRVVVKLLSGASVYVGTFNDRDAALQSVRESFTRRDAVLAIEFAESS